MEWRDRPETLRLHRQFRDDPVRGAQPRTAGEWLAWRDSQGWMIRRFAREIAELSLALSGQTMLLDWATASIKAIADVFLRAELLVWEEPQWQEVLHSAPAFAGSRLEGLSREMHVWTWPGDRLISPEARAQFGLEEDFDLGAMILAPTDIRESALDALMDDPRLPRGWRESLIETHLTMAMYFTRSVRDAARYEAERDKILRTRDPSFCLPRIVFLQHRRSDECRQGWEAIAAGAGFLRERIFVTEKMDQTRQMRRAYERAQPGHCSSVQRVVLRHIERRPAEGGHESGREYHSRWWVGGHWRKRAEVWNRGDGPIWVKAHVKGPEDAPLIPKNQRLTHVSR